MTMKMKSKNIRRKSVAVLAGVAIVGAVGASAATLGGLNSDSLGADADVVASCDTDGVAVEYTTSYSSTGSPDGTAGGYIVDSMNVTGVNDACAGLAYEIVLTDVNGAELDDGDGTVALTGTVADDNSFEVQLTGEASAEAVTGVALVISG